MTRIGPAPVLRPLGDERSWVQWFSQLGDGLSGRWGQEWRSLSLTNLDAPTQQLLNYRGSEVSFLLYWDSGVTLSSSSIALETQPERADLSFWPAVLQIWDDTSLVGGATLDGRTITFPDLGALGGRVIVQGTGLIKTRNPRGVV